MIILFLFTYGNRTFNLKLTMKLTSYFQNFSIIDRISAFLQTVLEFQCKYLQIFICI